MFVKDRSTLHIFVSLLIKIPGTIVLLQIVLDLIKQVF